MDVLINGVRYIPESERNHITVHGIMYDNVANWLENIHARLISKWHKTLQPGQPPNITTEGKIAYGEIIEFENFAEKYLGYKQNEEYSHFIEVCIEEITESSSVPT